MARGATLALKITGDSRDGVRALKDADDATGRWSKGAGLAAGAAGAVVAGVLAIGKAAFDAASSLEQSSGAIESVFGDLSGTMTEAAKAAVDTVGLSQSAYQDMAAVLGAQLKNMGLPMDQVTGQTQDLIGMGADLAATFGGPTSDAVNAVSSLLRGETDPIERYGISIKQADINARLAAMGLGDLEGEAAKAAQAQAVLGLLTEQTGSAQGAFAREAGTAAGASQRLSAWWDNLMATLGEKLLPLFVKAVDFFRDNVAPVLERLVGNGGALSEVFGVIADHIMNNVVPAVTSLWNELGPKLVPIFETVGRIIQDFLLPAFNAIWAFIQDYVVPIFSSILGPALDGIGTALKTVEEKLGPLKDAFQKVWDTVKPFFEFLRDHVAPFLGDVFMVAFEVLGEAIGVVVDAISWILDRVSDVVGFFEDVGGFLFGSGGPAGGAPAPAPAGAGMFGAARGAPALFAASGSLFGGGTGPSAAGQGLSAGDTYNITVNGALDPAAVADQIDRMLDRRARRIGAAPAFGSMAAA